MAIVAIKLQLLTLLLQLTWLYIATAVDLY